jgi:hypothetical protein
MSDATQGQDPDMEPEIFETDGTRPGRVTQAQWDAQRKASKARAAVTVKANAKKAEAAKKRALAKGPTFDTGDLATKAAEIEKRTNKRAADKLEAQGKDGLRTPAEVKK